MQIFKKKMENSKFWFSKNPQFSLVPIIIIIIVVMLPRNLCWVLGNFMLYILAKKEKQKIGNIQTPKKSKDTW